MNIGWVQQKEVKTDGGTAKFLEMSIRAPFGSMTATLTKYKPKEGEEHNENSPDYYINFSPNRKGESFDRMRVGALWMKQSQNNETYMSGYIDSPFMVPAGRLHINVVKYVHREGMKVQPILYNVLWSSQAENDSHKRRTASQGGYDDGRGGDYDSGYADYQESVGQSQQVGTTAGGAPVTVENAPAHHIPEIDISEEEIPF